jgi:hypothetical protein
MLGKRSSSVPIGQPTGFTPRQVIGLVVAMAFLLIALPVGAKAAGSLVTLVDSSSSTQARVDAATGGLRVGGITNKILDKSGSFTSLNQVLVFTTGTSPYSKVRIYQP